MALQKLKSTSWTDSDDEPLKYKNFDGGGQRWTEMDKNSDQMFSQNVTKNILADITLLYVYR